MASKRKLDGEVCDQNEHNIMCLREFYERNPDSSSPRDRFEMTRLYRTNQEMADFVRESVAIMRMQQAEIERLNGIIARLHTR